MKLYLVQHGEATSKEVNPDRPLTEKGISDVNKVAHFINNTVTNVSNIYHSGKARAKETAQIFGQVPNFKCEIIEKENLSPNDPIDPIYNEVNETNDDLMIVGHLPFLTKLASKLTCGDEEKQAVKFSQGGALCLEKTDDNLWQVNWFVIADLL